MGRWGGGEETEGKKNYEGKEGWRQGEDRCSNRNRCCNRSVRLIGEKDVITPSATTTTFFVQKRTFIFQAKMAAFIVGKSMKDRRATKAIEELFDRADKNKNGRISVEDYVNIFSEHGVQVNLQNCFLNK